MLDWSKSTVQAGTVALSALVAAVIGNLVGFGFWGIVLAVSVVLLLILGGHIAWKRGFSFPDTLTPRISPEGLGADRVWSIDLQVENPGRTDKFVVRIDGIRGSKAPSSAVGTYPNWRGEASGDGKLIRKDDRATFALCTWDPGEDRGADSEPDVLSTVNASTGSVPVTLTEAGAKFAGNERHELVYELCLISDKTEKRIRYDVHIGTVSISDPSPRVHVERPE